MYMYMYMKELLLDSTMQAHAPEPLKGGMRVQDISHQESTWQRLL